MTNHSGEEEFVVVDAAPRGTISAQTHSRAVKVSSSTSSIRKLLMGLVALLVVLGAISLLGGRAPAVFPALPPGSYVGTLQGAVSSPVTLYIEKTDQSGPLFIFALKQGWDARLVDSPLGDAPLEITSPEGNLIFSGSEVSAGVIAGKVKNRDSGVKGAWSINRLEAGSDFGLTDTERGSLGKWLQLRAEQQSVEAGIAKVELDLKTQNEEIDRLNTFLNDEQLLKSRADKSFDETKIALQVAQEKLRKKRSEADKLSEQLKISERVTSAGKLVSLARESLEREGRWQESMLKTEVGSPEFQSELERAERVQALKHAINAAREKLIALQPARALEGGKASPWENY